MTRISELDKLTTNVQFKEKERVSEFISTSNTISRIFFICFSLLGKYHL